MTRTQPDLRSDKSMMALGSETALKPHSLTPRRVAQSWWERFRHSRDALPLSLLAAFLLISLVTVLSQAYKYGITLDEPLMQGFGVYIAKFYQSLAGDRSFLTATGVGSHQPEHGGAFDAGVVAIQGIFKNVDPWLVRHMVTGVAGWLGIIGIALCGYELSGPWVALAASLGLWLFPRYYGAMYNNPKDVPAAAAMTFVIWATLLLIKHWNHRERALAMSALLGCCIGVATAIRATALSWFAVLIALLVGWWLLHGRSVWRERRLSVVMVQQLVVIATVGVSTFLSIMALWPYVYVNPFTNLYQAIIVLSHYPWHGTVFFNGQDSLAMRLPSGYVSTWILIGSPPMLLALAALGVGVIVAEAVRRRRIDAPVWVAPIGFALSLAPLLLLHPVLYDTLRQFLYIFPPLILVGAYGLVRSVSWLRRQGRPALRWAAVALLAVTLVSYSQTLVEMVMLSPYEYTYFSPLVGGLPGAASKFDTDYYGTCTKAAGEWLTQNYQRYTSVQSPSIEVIGGLITPFMPATVTYTNYTNAQPDFYISTTRNKHDQEYPSYQLIHVVAAEGVTLCVVKVNPAISKGT